MTSGPQLTNSLLRRAWPPRQGTFWFQTFIQGPSLEMWRKTISGAEGGSGEEVGGLFWATSLKKISAARPRSSRTGQVDGCSSLPYRGVLSFMSEAREASGSETPRFHHAARRRGGVAARGADAAADHARDWVSQ